LSTTTSAKLKEEDKNHDPIRMQGEDQYKMNPIRRELGSKSSTVSFFGICLLSLAILTGAFARRDQKQTDQIEMGGRATAKAAAENRRLDGFSVVIGGINGEAAAKAPRQEAPGNPIAP
jgi:hypothetical protein